jgi:hypothetical protein
MTAATMRKSVLSNGAYDLAHTTLATPHLSRAIGGDGLNTNAQELATPSQTHCATDTRGKLNPNAPEFTPIPKPQSSSVLVGVWPGPRTDQKFIRPSQMTPKLAPSVSLIGMAFIASRSPSEVMEGALQSDNLIQDLRAIGPAVEAREPTQVLPDTANLHMNLVNLVRSNPPAQARGDVHEQIQSLGEVIFVDSALFSYSELGMIARVGKEWRQLAGKGMQQLLNLSLPSSGNVNLQQAKRTFSEKLLHIDLQGGTFNKGMQLWWFIKQAFELCSNLLSIDLRQCNGTGLTQAAALATRQRCEQRQGVTMTDVEFYIYLGALKPYENSEKSLFDGVWAILEEEQLVPRILLEHDFVPSRDALSEAV